MNKTLTLTFKKQFINLKTDNYGEKLRKAEQFDPIIKTLQLSHNITIKTRKISQNWIIQKIHNNLIMF